ncbi:hypothetical protein [Streptomyces inusitatus]|uniref:hypothetical protein n=1 Tax=Streptomyces inusitatus TaxID=68221 RepID=UPI00167E3041|nr:hypothetical protein [Streptomyces inusitatus]
MTSKYSPLRNIGFGDDEDYGSKLMRLRTGILRGMNLIGRLEFVVENWADVRTTEANAQRRPPLVVVSTGRADWISAGVNAAKARGEALNGAGVPLRGIGDMRALGLVPADEGNLPALSPVYSPGRVGDHRSVYLMVNAREYTYYAKKLKDTGITVVGWQSGNGMKTRLAGFGASRFAALQFCKELRAGHAAWPYAWVFDDNVVALTGLPVRGQNQANPVPDGLSGIEDAVVTAAGAAEPFPVCVGFQAGTAAKSAEEIGALATKNVDRAPIALTLEEKPGLVQQAVLWNMGRLNPQVQPPHDAQQEGTDWGLNIGPAFVASAEDVSMINYFKRTGIPYRQYKGIAVVKAAPAEDRSGNLGNKGAADVRAYREEIARVCARAESESFGVDPQNPPPPVRVRDQVLSSFLAALNGASANGAFDQNKAACQAVEQMMAKALTDDAQARDQTALESVFKIRLMPTVFRNSGFRNIQPAQEGP